jgi:hypothetical protein
MRQIVPLPITSPIHDWIDTLLHRDPHHRLQSCLRQFKAIIEYETSTPHLPPEDIL